MELLAQLSLPNTSTQWKPFIMVYLMVMPLQASGFM